MSAHTNDGGGTEGFGPEDRSAAGGGHDWQADPRLLAYALEEHGELGPEDVAEIEAALASDPVCRATLDELRTAIQGIEATFAVAAPGTIGLSDDVRSTIRRAAGRRGAPGWVAPLVAAGLLGAVGATVWSIMDEGEWNTFDAGADRVTDLATASEGPRPRLGQGGGGRDASRPKIGGPAGNAMAPAAESFRSFDTGMTPPAPELAKQAGRKGDAKLERRSIALGDAGPDQSVDLALAPEQPVESLDSELDEMAQAREFVPPPENPFVRTVDDPFSTFSIDVDTASYSRARAALQSGSMPDPGTVRVEEFINYFDYDDAPPRGTERAPFAVHVETAAAPWAPEHRLVRIGIQAEEIDFARRESANLVFLVDVSGSMRSPEKLPLVQGALATLTASMRADDRIAIVVYASAEGLVLDSTPVAAREAILQALERLQAGGSTNGGAGIRLAYDIARRHFVTGGINRVVLCTDGDFNVGTTSVDALEELVAREAATGVELTVLGFGQSTGGDARMEALSNRGNGNYAMIDSALEAQRVLGQAVGGTLVTVAKDVKIQVAWNPDEVSAFRLVGYENRMLAHADFLDDRVDAGEIGSGHHVTALYEVVPSAIERGLESADLGPSAMRVPEAATADAGPEPFGGDGLLEVRLRYKLPGGDVSSGVEFVGRDGGATFGGGSDDLRFAAAVAAFAQRLRGSERVQHVGFDEIRRWALEAKGEDPGGLREAFIRLVERAGDLGR